MIPFSTVISDRDYWFFRSPVHIRELFVNGLTGGDGVIWLNDVDITTIIFNLSSTVIDNNTLLQTSSSTWLPVYATVNVLSGNWQSTYTTVQTNSAIWGGAVTLPLSAITAAGATTTDTMYLSNVNTAALQSTSITTTGISIDTHAGITKARKIILMDEDGNSFEVHLRSGILTID